MVLSIYKYVFTYVYVKYVKCVKKNSRRTIDEKAYEAAHDAALNLVYFIFIYFC